jgi:hypothetical protein
MAIKIVDAKRVEMTTDEWTLYEKICASYDDLPAQRGRDFFQDLFESNEEGLITFLKPPKRQSTMEVCLFLINLMCQQHLRKSAKLVEEAVKRVDEKLQQIDKAMAALEEKKSDPR